MFRNSKLDRLSTAMGEKRFTRKKATTRIIFYCVLRWQEMYTITITTVICWNWRNATSLEVKNAQPSKLSYVGNPVKRDKSLAENWKPTHDFHLECQMFMLPFGLYFNAKSWTTAQLAPPDLLNSSPSIPSCSSSRKILNRSFRLLGSYTV